MISYSQIIYEQPQRPTFEYITTLDIATGRPTLYWTPPPHNPLYPDPIGYIIYKKFVDPLHPLGIYEAIDSVLVPATSYTDNSTSFNDGRVTYTIASKGPTKPSQTQDPHSNIFIDPNKTFYDSCNNAITLFWDRYLGWGNRIKKYDVYMSNNPAIASFVLQLSLPSTTNTARFSNITQNQDYYFYIVATKDTTSIGGLPYTTKSNLFYKRTAMPVHPTSMTVDSIMAEDDRNNIYFKIDPSTELANFQVVRWEHPDSTESIFSRKILHPFSDKYKTFYSDTSDSWAARTRPFYYKIDALNSCPKIVKVTNHANSITPNIVAENNMQNRIEWDELFIDRAIPERSDNYARYRVIRYAYKATPLPPVYLPETDQTELIDDVSELSGDPDPYSIKFCYQIEAFERNLLGQIAMFSKSRIQCVDIIPGVVMPNAIMPADYTTGFDKTRNILAPTITFRANYTLSIYNRWGSLIFSSENMGWDGHMPDGQLAREGTYIYRLVVHTVGNRDVIKEGSFVVVYK